MPWATQGCRPGLVLLPPHPPDSPDLLLRGLPGSGAHDTPATTHVSGQDSAEASPGESLGGLSPGPALPELRVKGNNSAMGVGTLPSPPIVPLLCHPEEWPGQWAPAELGQEGPIHWPCPPAPGENTRAIYNISSHSSPAIPHKDSLNFLGLS